MKSKELLQKFIGNDGFETLEKAIYKDGSRSVLDPSEFLLPLMVVPRTILSWLVQNIRPMKVGEHKEIKIPHVADATLWVQKQDIDVYRGELSRGGKIIQTFDKQSLPTIGATIMSAGENYDHLLEADKPSKDELIQEHEKLVDVLESPSHEDDKKEAKKQKEELKSLKEEKADSSEVVKQIMLLGGGMQCGGGDEQIKWITSHSSIKELTGVIGKLVDALVAKKIDPIAKDELKDSQGELKETKDPTESFKEQAKAKKEDVKENKEGAQPILTQKEIKKLDKDNGPPKCEKVPDNTEAKVTKDEIKEQKPQEKGIHMPVSNRSPGVSDAGELIRNKSIPKAVVTQEHKAVIHEMEKMPKPNLKAEPKAEMEPTKAPAKHKLPEPLMKPYVSQAQRRWAHTPTGTKALGGKAAVEHWDKASKGKDMPEKKPIEKASIAEVKSVKGVHKPIGKPDSGQSAMSMVSNPTQKKNLANMVLQEQKAMPKPNLPKEPVEKAGEMPSGRGMPKPPQMPQMPKPPVGPSKNPKGAAEKQGQLAQRGHASAPKIQGAPQMKKPGGTPKGPQMPKPPTPPTMKSENTGITLKKEELMTKCPHCNKSEFSDNNGKIDFTPCACFRVMRKAEDGSDFEFVKISKNENGTFNLYFNKNADQDAVKAFLLSLKAKLLIGKKYGIF